MDKVGHIKRIEELVENEVELMRQDMHCSDFRFNVAVENILYAVQEAKLEAIRSDG